VPKQTFVLASANRDKAVEIAAILGCMTDVILVPRPDEVPDVEETGDTLEDNARLKAVALASATGLPAVADDTGLEVEALGGAPGVYSARFAGEGSTYADNVAMLVAELARVGAVTPDSRRARFRSVAFVAWPDG
jgi:XTP/dITP diphosphohydrolase